MEGRPAPAASDYQPTDRVPIRESGNTRSRDERREMNLEMRPGPPRWPVDGEAVISRDRAGAYLPAGVVHTDDEPVVVRLRPVVEADDEIRRMAKHALSHLAAVVVVVGHLHHVARGPGLGARGRDHRVS